MTEKESELIERLMQGDMEAYDELMPNARPEDRANFEDAIKKAREIGGEQYTISRAWLIFVLYLIGKNVDDFRKYDREANQRLADGWNKAMSDAIDKLKKIKNADVFRFKHPSREVYALGDEQ